MVGPRRDQRAEDRRHEDPAGELEAERSGWRDEGDGGEDDVRSGDEEAGETDE